MRKKFCSNGILREEQGLTLLEIVVTIVIVGVALPSLFVLMGNLSYQTVKNRILTNAVNHANSRMEQIMAFKDGNIDWYDNIDSFDEVEALDNGFTRTTALTHHNDWEGTGFEAFQVDVGVTHAHAPDGYNLSFILTYYSK